MCRGAAPRCIIDIEKTKDQRAVGSLKGGFDWQWGYISNQWPGMSSEIQSANGLDGV